MLKRVVILFLLCVGCLKYVGAQQIFISDPQKISTELIGYNILGKNKNGDALNGSNNFSAVQPMRCQPPGEASG